MTSHDATVETGEIVINPLLLSLLAINAAGRLPGTSDQALLGDVTQIAIRERRRLPGKALTAVPQLNRVLDARAVDALRWLAESSGIRYPAGLFHYQRNWAQLRYLGLFDLPQPFHSLSGIGEQFRGNHRRVVSEDLGIGFGLLVAEHWCRIGIPNAVVSAIDIDVPLAQGFHHVKGRRVPVTAAAGRRRRPDYLLVIRDPARPRFVDLRVLECKGTGSLGHVKPQLASAVGQLDGVTVGGSVPTGLAVSTFTGRANWSFAAIDPEDKAVRFEINQQLLNRVSGELSLRAEVKDDGSIDIDDGEGLVAAALAASFASLADFSGNYSARERFIPVRLKTAWIREFGAQRKTVTTPVGRATGTLTEFVLGEQRFECFQGVVSDVDEALSGSEVGSIISAQDQLSSRLVSWKGEAVAESLSQDSEGRVQDEGVWSVGPSGAAVGIRLPR